MNGCAFQAALVPAAECAGNAAGVGLPRRAGDNAQRRAGGQRLPQLRRVGNARGLALARSSRVAHAAAAAGVRGNRVQMSGRGASAALVAAANGATNAACAHGPRHAAGSTRRQRAWRAQANGIADARSRAQAGAMSLGLYLLSGWSLR
jgi:hypothetical protein